MSQKTQTDDGFVLFPNQFEETCEIPMDIGTGRLWTARLRDDLAIGSMTYDVFDKMTLSKPEGLTDQIELMFF
ncbi:MAG: hypothetical protein OEZ36_14405, partial [Spirochaetota bacterium]|nr:hypothetical protein [Spirochaetota bacterium]